MARNLSSNRVVKRVCPETGEPVNAVVIQMPDNNQGLVVPCLDGQLTKKCPLGRRYVCLFSFGEM